MMKTRLSVNINKFATLRNSRGGNIPDLIFCALACEKFGADGITVHPRPDERHIRYNDVRELKGVLSTEFNIEGNPGEQKFIDLVTEIRPAQVTLVPDSLSQLTSDHGWDTNKHQFFLRETIGYFKSLGIRTSIFVDPVEQMIRSAKDTGTDRIELYTESYAAGYAKDQERAIKPFVEAAVLAQELQIGINAGHDLNLHNLSYFKQYIPGLLEVSIGHALVADAIFLGLEECIRRYKACLIETGSESS